MYGKRSSRYPLNHYHPVVGWLRPSEGERISSNTKPKPMDVWINKTSARIIEDGRNSVNVLPQPIGKTLQHVDGPHWSSPWEKPSVQCGKSTPHPHRILPLQSF